MLKRMNNENIPRLPVCGWDFNEYGCEVANSSPKVEQRGESYRQHGVYELP